MPKDPRAAGLRRERMQSSPLWRGDGFANPSGKGPGLSQGSALPVLKEFLRGGNRRTPPLPLPSLDPREMWQRPVETGLRVTWLGHSTLLLELGGVKLLTDPVWGERASPVAFAGPKRFQPVPVPIASLPPLDAVVISHDHYDHLDYSSVMALAQRDVPFITSLGVGGHLESWGIPSERIVELDWWQSVERSGVRITATPAQHFSGRGLGDRNRTLWSSFAVESDRAKLFFSGDTGLTDDYREIARRLGAFDLVMLEVGAFHPAWGHIHLGPDNALSALSLLGGGALLPVHWGTFNLALHAWDQPAERLLELAPAHGARLVMPRIGQALEVERAREPVAWWREIARAERAGVELPPPTPAMIEPID